jgi:4-hydroxy-4-methyl-2-oxoglutarate aldolase
MSTSPTELAAALGAFSLPTLSDSAGDAARVIATLSPLGQGMRLAGPAYTVAGVAGDNLALHRALHHCPPGFVLVATIQGGSQNGHWGALMALAAREKGILGLVIDGTVRDADEMAALPFAVFAAGVHPRKGAKAHPGELNVPITCAGVAVHPGDIVIGDEHGVLVLPVESAPAVLERAEQLARREEGIIERLKRGESLSAILGVDVT